jgi:hypothetical protein
VAFVRKKMVKGSEYYQLVEAHRVDGKPRQKVLVHLNKHTTVDDALQSWPTEISNLLRRAKRASDTYEALPEWLKGKRFYKKKRDFARVDMRKADTLRVKLRKLRDLRNRGVV